MAAALHGVIVVDKPKGPTSHDVVAAVRRWARPSRTGHTGTLDPMATGVLPVCMGAATRLSRFLTRGPKEYAGVITLGVRTDTDDAEGTVLASSPAVAIRPGDLRRAAADLTGDLMQVPPRWSAKKIGGRRAYDLARAGEEPRPEPCRVRVDLFDVVLRSETHAEFRVVCSGGTYVRSLARDLGEALGCGAHLSELRRLRSGPFTLDEAHGLIEIEQAAAEGRLESCLIPPERLDLGMETARLTPEGTRSAIAGRTMAGAEFGALPEGTGPVRLLDPDGRLLGVAERIDGPPVKLQPRVILAGTRARRP